MTKGWFRTKGFEEESGRGMRCMGRERGGRWGGEQKKKYGVSRNRIRDLLHAKQALYQLSYNPVKFRACGLATGYYERESGESVSKRIGDG